MAQKVNPIAVRLGYNRLHDSNWFSDYYYSTLVSQDLLIRRYLKQFPRSIIFHSINKTSVFVFCLKSSSVVPSKQLLEARSTLSRRSGAGQSPSHDDELNHPHLAKTNYLLSNSTNSNLSSLQAQYTRSRKLKLQKATEYKPIQVNSIYQSASLLAQAICSKLEQNKSFKQICRTIVRECEQIQYIKGIRLVCSGRLNGAEMAKTVCHKYGETSLHVFSDRIDYASMSANTPYGLLGIKVWISLK